MKKLKVLIIVPLIGAAGVFVYRSGPVQNAIGVTLSFLQPNIWKDVKNDWEKMPTDFLLKKLKGGNDIHAGIAIEILVERKEMAAVPYLLERTRSDDDQSRLSAFIALGKLGDERAIQPMMDVVAKGRGDKAYMDALYGLSLMHYEPVYPEILKNAKDGYEASLTTWMLAQFPDKSETLPALRKIATEAPESYVQEKARKAIASIESTQGKKSK